MTTTRPTRIVNTPRRANAVTVSLFALLLGVAYLNTREPPPPALGDIVKPPGWQVGFAPPKGWNADGESLGPRHGRMRTFVSADDRRRVSLGRLPVKGDESVEAVCREVLRYDSEPSMISSLRDVHISECNLGDWPGVLLEWTPELMGQIVGDHLYVLGAIAPSTDAGGQHQAYIFQFQSPAPLTEKDARFWSLLVDSIVTEGPQP